VALAGPLFAAADRASMPRSNGMLQPVHYDAIFTAGN
jgi:hypothetical protein